MRYLERNKTSMRLEVGEKERGELEAYLSEEVEDALSARAMQEGMWNECLRLYEAMPEREFRDAPIEGYRNIEVPLIAVSSDAIYAQMIDMIFTVSPVITVQAVDKGDVKGAKGLQKLVNWGVGAMFGLRNAVEHSTLDDVQLGSGFYYIPWTEKRVKRKTDKLILGGPRIYSIPPEDFIVPGGATDDLQAMPWVDMRTWVTKGDLAWFEKYCGWDIEGVMPAGGVEWVRSRRETLGRTATSGARHNGLFEIHNCYVQFDVDGDGFEEDLLVVWDRFGHKIMSLEYNPFDSRPFEAMRYQIRGHLFYGMGVAEMLRALQHEESEIHNHRIINMMLANTKMFADGGSSLPETISVWPGRVLKVADPDKFRELKLSEVYTSSAQAEAAAIALAERRVGINELSMPRPSQVMGNRTPGITMMTLMQQTNRRFAPAFDGARMATAGAVKQCLYRMQERLLAGDEKLMNLIGEVVGQMATETLGLLGNENFDEAINVQLTASSAQQNREVERQNQLLLVNLMSGYYKATLEMALVAANPQTPQGVKETADKIIRASTEVMDRTLRTFDSIRDPESLLIEMEEEIDQVQAPGGDLGILGQIMQGLAGMEQQNGGGMPPPAFGSI